MWECACGFFPIPPRDVCKQSKIPTFWELTSFYSSSVMPEIKINGFSENFNNLISKCLQKDPSLRPKASKLLKEEFIKNIDEIDGRKMISLFLSTTQ